MKTIDLGTITSVSATTGKATNQSAGDAAEWTVYLTGTGTTPSFQVECSPNGANWINEGAPVTSLPGKVNSSTRAPFVRVNCTAGTALNATATYVG